MENQNQERCMFCGETVSMRYENNNTYRFVECPVCGRYYQHCFPIPFGELFKNEISSYLFYSKNERKTSAKHNNYVHLGEKDFDCKDNALSIFAYYASEEEIKAFYPRKFTERIDRILLGLAEKSSFVSDVVEMSVAEALSAFFVKRFDGEGDQLTEKEVKHQFSMICDYLEKNDLIDLSYGTQDVCRIMITPEGWKRIDQLQQREENISKKVFVAMSFSENMRETRETIKEAITKCGYLPRIMDEIEHNHQIVPEMLYEIRTSRFVIAELTGHNNGAYFEAGYALGYGKEVIQVCNKANFREDGHFDVKQINTVMWENQEDLRTRLIARIEATIS